jgi:hypothetical protein
LLVSFDALTKRFNIAKISFLVIGVVMMKW